MKKLVFVAVLLIGGLLISENVNAQSFNPQFTARVSNGDVCPIDVTLNWAGGCAPSTSLTVAPQSFIDVAVPCGGPAFESADIIYTGAGGPNPPVNATIGNTPALNCAGAPTVITITPPTQGFYFIDMNG
ncbi:MAG: hypothetical protein AAGB22_06280 [Bacteroidota bacterium]